MNEELERLLGARVISLERVVGRGYTQAGRHRAQLDDGRSVFVKSAVDELTAGWLRLEHVVYASVDGRFLPRFYGYGEQSGLPFLVLEDLTGAHWPPPWREGDIAAVRAALDALANVEAPVGLTPAQAHKDDWAGRWQELADDPEPFVTAGVASRAWLDESLPTLRAAAAQAPMGDGDALLHLDVRSDNIGLAERGAVLVDWNWASVGNPLLDVVGWTPSLCVETGMAPESVVDGEGVAEFGALICGIWAIAAGRPAPPTAAPGVRELQRAMLDVALPWTCRLLRIPEPG